MNSELTSKQLRDAAKALCDKMPRGEGLRYFHAGAEVSALRAAIDEYAEPPTADRICDDELKITYEHGQPYGIRDRGGYLFFFSKISKYSGQEERYRDEVAQAYKLADFLLRSLQRVAVTKDATNGGMMPTCPNCGHDPCADWCKADEQHTDSLIEKLESVVGDETNECPHVGCTIVGKHSHEIGGPFVARNPAPDAAAPAAPGGNFGFTTIKR